MGGGIPSQVSPARADSKVSDSASMAAWQSYLACQLSMTLSLLSTLCKVFTLLHNAVGHLPGRCNVLGCPLPLGCW